LQALESEIVAHEPLIEAVTNLANRMVAKQHPAENDIKARLKDLLVRLQELKTLTAERKLKLLDAVESQTV
jgi:spectrin beta